MEGGRFPVGRPIAPPRGPRGRYFSAFAAGVALAPK